MAGALQWVRLDTDWFSHPKFLQLRAARRYAAISCYWSGLAWSGAHLRDGFIADYALPLWGATRREARQLVEVGLWDEAPGGFMVPDWQDYQPTAAEVRQRSERQRANARKRWGDRGDPVTER